MVHGQELVWFLALVFLFLWESWNVNVWWALVYPPGYIWRILNLESELQAQNATSAHSLRIDALSTPLQMQGGFHHFPGFSIFSIGRIL